MPYNTVFGPLSSAQTSDLDDNFNAAGLLGTLPCSVSGTNALTLTPLSSVPQPRIFAPQEGLRVSAIAAASNTTTVTASVASGPVLNVYKDTPSGPAALTGGEIVTGNYFVLTYDAALNTGAGGWHLQTTPASSLGTVTSVATGTGLTGGPITTTGTLSLATIATLNILANTTGGTAAPTANTLSAILDAVIGTSQGSIISRGASLWAGNTEAAWTPALSFGGSSSGITYATQVGQQMQIGYLTIAMFNLVLTSKGAQTGSSAISLPSTAGGSSRIGSGLVTSYTNLDSSVTSVPFLQISSGGSTAGIVIGGAGAASAVADSKYTNSSTLAGFMFYFTG